MYLLYTGCKSDVPEKAREVSTLQGKNLAKEIKAHAFFEVAAKHKPDPNPNPNPNSSSEVSSKSDEGVESLFETASRILTLTPTLNLTLILTLICFKDGTGTLASGPQQAEGSAEEAC